MPLVVPYGKQDRTPEQEFLRDLYKNTTEGVPDALNAIVGNTAIGGATGLYGTGRAVINALRQGRGVTREDMSGVADLMQANTEKYGYKPRTEYGENVLGGLESALGSVENAANQIPKVMERGGLKPEELRAAGGPQAIAAGAPMGERINDAFGPEVAALLYTGAYAAPGGKGSPKARIPTRGFESLESLAPRVEAQGARGAPRLTGPETVEALRTGKGAKPPGMENTDLHYASYGPEDLAGVEGDFGITSPTMAAFDRLKKQEQGRVTGKQLRSALQREGAKKEELSWMGLDDILNSNELFNAQEVRALAERNQPEIVASTARGTVDKYTEDDVVQRIEEETNSDSDLAYPWVVQRDGEVIGTYDNRWEARDAMREEQRALTASETEHYLENISEHLEPERLAEMTPQDRQQWAEDQAWASVHNDMSWDFTRDEDAGPTNYDEIYQRWDTAIRANPAYYGLGKTRNVPAHGGYTVEGEGRKPEANYSVSTMQLKGDPRYERGTHASVGDDILPYMSAPDDFGKLLEGYSKRKSEAAQAGQPFDEQEPSRTLFTEAQRRKKLRTDPDLPKYQQDDFHTHYSDYGPNQMLFARETDRPAPDWGSTKVGIGPQGKVNSMLGRPWRDPELDRPMRLLEEAQSDWYQLGRKSGWADEKGLVKARAEDAEMRADVSKGFKEKITDAEQALSDPTVDAFIAKVREKAAADPQRLRTGMYEGQLLNHLEKYERMRSDPNADPIDMGTTLYEVYNTLYYMSSDPQLENTVYEARRKLSNLPTMDTLPSSRAVSSGPMRETPQYTKLAVIDALRRAVQEGQQYFAWTPGDVHSKRWGTDTFQYAIDPSDPNKVRWTSNDMSRMEGKTAEQNLQDVADRLFESGGSRYETLDLGEHSRNLEDWNRRKGENESQGLPFTDPEPKDTLDDQIYDIVKRNLDYGIREYQSYPDKFRKKRAAALRKQIEDMSKDVTSSGQRRSSHYSPRQAGYDMAYSPIEQVIIDVLRETGSQAEIKDIPVAPSASAKPLRGIEFDPVLARAMKKGQKLPY